MLIASTRLIGMDIGQVGRISEMVGGINLDLTNVYLSAKTSGYVFEITKSLQLIVNDF